MNATLIYCYDPMCSWCWGFAPTWTQLQKQLTPLIEAGELTIQPMLGGLAMDSEEPMAESMKLSLQSTWNQIQQQLGTDFNHQFWSNCQPRRSTYPACRACLLARDHGLEAEMQHAIQKAYYLNAQNPSDLETLADCAHSLGLKPDAFLHSMRYIKREALLEKEVQQARQLGLNSFPSLAMIKNDALHPIALDYKNANTMFEQIKDLL